jgi:hypothetical protein
MPSLSRPFDSRLRRTPAIDYNAGYGGQQEAPQRGGAPQVQQQPAQQTAPQMSYDQQLRAQNSGSMARGPSGGSTLGRADRFANNPTQGAIVARMSQQPGSQAAWAAPYADIMGAGMAPQLQQNQMGQAAADAFPGMAQAQTAKTNAEAYATKTNADGGVNQMKGIQDQLKQSQARIKELETQLAKGTPAPQKPVPITEQENVAAEGVGYGGVMAMRQGKAPGDPTTRPTVEGGHGGDDVITGQSGASSGAMQYTNPHTGNPQMRAPIDPQESQSRLAATQADPAYQQRLQAAYATAGRDLDKNPQLGVQRVPQTYIPPVSVPPGGMGNSPADYRQASQQAHANQGAIARMNDRPNQQLRVQNEAQMRQNDGARQNIAARTGQFNDQRNARVQQGQQQVEQQDAPQQQQGQLSSDGRSGTLGGFQYVLGPDGLMHRVK